MAFVEDNAIALAAGDVSVDLNGVAGTETVLYTVPTNSIYMYFALMLTEFSAAVTAAVVTVGIGGGDCDEFGTYTLTNVSGTTKYVILQPVPAATPVGLTILTAGQTVSIEITTAEGSALTCKAEVLGLRKAA